MRLNDGTAEKLATRSYSQMHGQASEAQARRPPSTSPDPPVCSWGSRHLQDLAQELRHALERREAAVLPQDNMWCDYWVT